MHCLARTLSKLFPRKFQRTFHLHVWNIKRSHLIKQYTYASQHLASVYVRAKMSDLRVAAAQFENKSGDKDYNLAVIDQLCQAAAAAKVRAILFHELCITGYTWLKDLGKEEVYALAEEVPAGPSTARLQDIARKHGLLVIAGLVELEPATGRVYNSMVAVDESGALLAVHRKLQVFIHPCLSYGSSYTVFDYKGWKCGILTCYDNLVVENVRATALLGAELIFAPHVTCGTPSKGAPGREAFFTPALWHGRDRDPAALRLEFDGPSGARWLHRWLPATAMLNGVYYVFSNPIGMDGPQLKNGNAMVLDCYGEVLTELKSFKDDIAVALCVKEKLSSCGGRRYTNARRPELYAPILSAPHASATLPVWLAK